MSDDDRRFAARHAKRIAEFHAERGDCTSNHFAENLSYEESLRRGLLTECAFANEFPGQVDVTLKPDGDGGRDFSLRFATAEGPRPFVVQIKTKSVRTIWPALRASGTHLRVPRREIRPFTIYVFGIYLELTNDADVLRWDWGQTLIRAGETVVFTKNANQVVDSYIRRFEDLRELGELKARLDGSTLW